MYLFMSYVYRNVSALVYSKSASNRFYAWDSYADTYIKILIHYFNNKVLYINSQHSEREYVRVWFKTPSEITYFLTQDATYLAKSIERNEIMKGTVCPANI